MTTPAHVRRYRAIRHPRGAYPIPMAGDLLPGWRGGGPMNAVSLREAIAAAGMDPPDHIEPGAIERFPGIGKGRSNRAGWCRLFEDRRGAVFGDYSTGMREVWQAERGATDARAARTAPQRKPTPMPKPSDYATRAWQAAEATTAGRHPYACAKGINWPAGARRGRISGSVVGRNADCLLVPIRDIRTHDLFAVQAINPDGAKQTFGPLKGHGMLIGNPLNKAFPWYVAEGWATAVSVVFHHHQGNACCGVAFGKSNLETLALRMAEVHEPARIVILAEAER